MPHIIRRAVSLILFVSAVVGIGVLAPNRAAATRVPVRNNDQIAYDFFVSKGLKPFQAAGIVGNLNVESGTPINPKIRQWGGGPGRGIAQWSVRDRWDTTRRANVVWYAKMHGMSPWALQTQLEFIWFELTTQPMWGLRLLRGTRNVTQATRIFMLKYERCGKCGVNTRLSSAKFVLAKAA